MAKQTLPEKATSYLVDGKIHVKEVDLERRIAHIEVTGSSAKPYNIWWTEAGFKCDCPAQIDQCAHVLAAKTIVPDLRVVEKPKIGQTDSDLDEFLSTICKPEPAEEISWEELV